MATRYIALIPAYEPDRRMLQVTGDLRDMGFDVVIVDDGSGAEFSDVFEEASLSATVLTHSYNMGKGRALKTGLEYISKYRTHGGYLTDGNVTEVRTVIVTVDADGQHLAGDAMRIARAAAAKPGTLVLGSRALDREVPLRSQVGNTITRHVYRLSTGVSVHDTQTGLRAFTSDLIPELLRIRGNRYEYEINMLLEFARKGIPIREEEISTVYLDGNSSSHFNTVRDSFRVYKEILKFSASSFLSFLVDYGMYALLLALLGHFQSAGSLALTAAGIIAAANIGARLVSSVFNYTLNRKLVFASRKSIGSTAAQYFGLAAFILAGNTIVLSTLTGTLGIGRMAAKIITEVFFFTISWLVQKYVIFYTRTDEARIEKPTRKSLRPVRGTLRVK